MERDEIPPFHITDMKTLYEYVQRNAKKNEVDTGGGYIYFILLPSTGQYKVGRSKNPDRRVKQIMGSSPIHDKPVLVHKLEVDDMVLAEKEFHRFYRRYHDTGEWFLLPEHVVNTIKEIKRWHMTAPPQMQLLLDDAA